MRPNLFVTAAALIFLPALAHAGECQFERSLTVNNAPALSVGTGSGDVHITPGSDGTVRVRGHVRSDHSGWFGNNHPEGNAQAVCDRPPIEQNGSQVRIGNQHDDIYRHVSIDYVIETPRMTEIAANSGSGNLDISDIGGRVSANTGSGDIRAANLGADAKLETGSGNIHASGLTGASRASTGSGDIHIEETGAGDVHASTGSGNIDVTGLNGALNAGTGSGWIHVDGTPSGNWKLETGSGDMKLRIASGKGYELDAEASSGEIHVEQPITMQGSLNKHHIHGVVSGGGSIIRISTGSGDIDLR
jgi:DUF4097 and DUF4098 domain-containing protein YvlB